jgi:murein endopeptidase
MRRRDPLLICALVVFLLTPGMVGAENMHVVEDGQTLWEIARSHGCTVKALKRANDIRGSTIYAGQTLVVPECSRRKGEKAEKTEKTEKTAKTEKTEQVDDGAADPADYGLVSGKVRTDRGQSRGAPWDGKLKNAVQLPGGKGYHIRRPHRAWGTTHAVTHVQRAVKAVRKRFPRVHTLAIGDFSAKKGGSISEHRSHQSGRDVDIGFYFKKQPKDYPDNFVGHDEAALDLAATWALLHAFARTADSPNGVQAIFVDYKVQKRLYRWAEDHGVPVDHLDRIFQYPDRDGTGLIRHVKNHHDHFHIRFKCPENDSGCEY